MGKRDPWNSNIIFLALCQIVDSNNYSNSNPVLGILCSWHRPCSPQVTEQMECYFVIHPPPSMYHNAINTAVCGQWAIQHNCQNDSSLIIFTMRDIVHWNYVTSQKSWASTKHGKYMYCQFMFLQLTLFFVHPILTPCKFISSTVEWPQCGLCDRSPWWIKDG